MRSLRTATKSSPRSAQPERARAQQWRPNAAKNKNKINFLKKEERREKEGPMIDLESLLRREKYITSAKVLRVSWWIWAFTIGTWLKSTGWASLVAQWLRICLPMQGTRVSALVWEDPTCHRANGPMSHNYWACVSGACAPQQERPR